MPDDIDEILQVFTRLEKACKELGSTKIVVGIVGSADSEVLKIAHTHEYGDGKMPERSFICASFDQDGVKLEKIVSAQINKVLDGQTTAKGAANAIGAQAAQLVQNFIDDNRVKPPSNFSRKTQYTTLYETGTHIRDRIAYKLEDA